MGLGHRWTQVPTGTRVCKQKHVHLETGVYTSTHGCTRIDSQTARNVCTCPPPTHTDPHLNTWAPDAGRQTLGHQGTQSYTQGRAHASRPHANIPPRGRADTHTRELADAHTRTQKNTPTLRPIASNHPLPQPRTRRARRTRTLALTPAPLPHARDAPGGLGVPPHTPPLPRGLSPHPPATKLTCSGGAPGPRPAPTPRRAPARWLRTPRQPWRHNLEQVAPFPHFGVGGRRAG